MNDIDFGAADSWDGEMPERLRWLRENEPVFWSEATGNFIITRYDDVVHVSKHSEIFCSGQGVLPGKLSATAIGLIDEDEPRHGEIRNLINRGFTPRMVGHWTGIFQSITDETLDEIAQRGECDFVEDIAVPLPLILIAEMIGIRREDRKRFHQWSDAMIAAQGNLDKPDVIAASGKAAMEYFNYVTAIIDDRRESPKSDLISILVRAKDDGVLGRKESNHADAIERELGRSAEHRAMSNDELIKMCVLLLVAGNETTRNALSGGMQLLIENPEARARLVADPRLIPQAVEEMLRLVSPVLSFQRTVTRDTELGGVPLREGQKVLMIYGAANRDAAQFEEPDRFDIDRKPQHVAFGIGNHFCLGANLARMELKVAFNELLRRFPDMDYAAGGPEFGSSALVRSVKHMQIRYTPEAQ
jgi:cytochrome P450 family 142 subfamily A polypeptide 1